MKAGHLVPKAADVQSDQISANVIRQGDNREFKSTVMTLSKAYDFLSICGLESGAAKLRFSKILRASPTEKPNQLVPSLGSLTSETALRRRVSTDSWKISGRL